MDNGQSAAGKEATRIMGVNDIESPCLSAIILIGLIFTKILPLYSILMELNLIKFLSTSRDIQIYFWFSGGWNNIRF